MNPLEPELTTDRFQRDREQHMKPPSSDNDELQLGFEVADARPLPNIPISGTTVRDVSVEPVDVSAILTKGTGFMDAFDYSLNPYMGCEYGCSYCYAAFFARDAELADQWGYWVKVKANAVEKLERMRTDLTGASIYMSSVTDPYQPIERDIELTRTLVDRLVRHQPRLVVQTRSGLVTRDADLFREINTGGGSVTVNVTVTTDSDEVRRAFEPRCPTNKVRLSAARKLVDAGIDTAITLSPLLPVKDVDRFADLLLDTGVQRFVTQPFHPERGRWVRGTREDALHLTRSFGWDLDRYRETVARLQELLPRLDEGKAGFAP